MAGSHKDAAGLKTSLDYHGKLYPMLGRLMNDADPVK